MSVLDKITKKTQDVVRGAKEFSDTTRLNSLISDEERQIEGLYSQIGKLYYKTQEPDTDSPIGKLCIAIKASNDRIKNYRDEIDKVKNKKRCPACNVDIPLASLFCGVCGTNLETAPEPVEKEEEKNNPCSGCGEIVEEGNLFCVSCGTKQ